MSDAADFRLLLRQGRLGVGDVVVVDAGIFIHRGPAGEGDGSVLGDGGDNRGGDIAGGGEVVVVQPEGDVERQGTGAFVDGRCQNCAFGEESGHLDGVVTGLGDGHIVGGGEGRVVGDNSGVVRSCGVLGVRADYLVDEARSARIPAELGVAGGLVAVEPD